MSRLPLALTTLLVSSMLSLTAVASEELQFYVREYRVEGARKLPRLTIEKAVYPFMGPARTAADVENARAALENSYHSLGFQTVSVSVPQQDPRHGIIRLTVTESTVGRLRVTCSNYFLPSRLRAEVPSLAEGKVPNLNQAASEIVAANRMADRKVTPALRPGSLPGTVDVDLQVEDKNPLHGSLELNNRYNANTTPLRLNGSLSHANLFQRGHTGGLSFQIAPENTDDALVFSSYYLARTSEKSSLLLQATKQDSDISTLGGASVGGRGLILGGRAVFDLPSSDRFYQTLNLGLDYKSFDENLIIGTDTLSSPIEYYPASLTYGATWITPRSFTEMNHSLNLGLRGLGSGLNDYTNKRYKSDGNFLYVRSDVSHTRDLQRGSQVFAKIQTQLANRPLINNDQFAGGGLGSARGYLEATALGDNAIFTSLEWRSPSFIGNPNRSNPRADEWRVHLFTDAGWLGLWEALPGQKSGTGFTSAGFGTRIRTRQHLNGSVDFAFPLIDQADANPGDMRITFRGWADF